MSDARQHADLTPERWARFSFDQQVLMVANEMNRATRLIEAEQWDHARRCYERVLNLVDLTATATTSSTRRRELLRWRDLAATLYLEEHPSGRAHREAIECLLRLTPAASAQIAFLPKGK